MTKETEVKQMLHEAPVNKVAPLHHDWTKHYWNDELESKKEEEEDAGKEDS